MTSRPTNNSMQSLFDDANFTADPAADPVPPPSDDPVPTVSSQPTTEQVVSPASTSPDLIALITQTTLAVVAAERAKDSTSAPSPASQSSSTPSGGAIGGVAL